MNKVIGKPLAVEPSLPPSGAVDRSTRSPTNSASVNPPFIADLRGPKPTYNVTVVRSRCQGPDATRSRSVYVTDPLIPWRTNQSNINYQALF